jgi:hypothetical protein
MNRIQFAVLCLAGLAGMSPAVHAQPAKPQPDILVLTDGERLVGHFVLSNGPKLTFKSDILGELHIDWAKVKELQAAGQYVVVGKNIELGRRSSMEHVPEGSIQANSQTVTVMAGPKAAPVNVPVADTAHVVERSEYEKVLNEPNFFHGWAGAVTAGASIVQATQQSRMFTGTATLVRAIPAENWMESRNRTSLNITVSDGLQLQPGPPPTSIKTMIFQAALEHDEYLSSSRFYAFLQADFDHNYSQGLDLAQEYGGGFGLTAIKSASSLLDVKVSASYLKQNFQTAYNDDSLFASTFGENYSHKLRGGVLFTQQLSATPTWNELSAWGTQGSAALTVPLYKKLNFSISTLDNFINNPPPGFRKNSFQATTGLTYSLR